MESSQCPMKSEEGALSPGVKRPGREATDIRMVQGLRMFELNILSPTRLHGILLNKYSNNLSFNFVGFLVQHRDHIQGDSFSTKPKKMRISQRLFIRF
jgi:hypothetical protein